MNINPVKPVRFGELTTSDIQNLERQIADLQNALDKRELEDIRQKAERDNRPFYPPSYNQYGRHPRMPYGMPRPLYGQPYGMPYGQPYGNPPYSAPCGMPGGQVPYGNPSYPPINGQPPIDTYGTPRNY